jgi:hypothetical protein
LHFLSRIAAPPIGQAAEKNQLNYSARDGNPLAMSSMLIMSIIPIDIVVWMLYT